MSGAAMLEAIHHGESIHKNVWTGDVPERTFLSSPSTAWRTPAASIRREKYGK